MTMSTMAVEPISIEVESWKIVSVTEENIAPATLPEMNKTELELKKKLEDHVGPVTDADDALYGAQEELKAARTGAARRPPRGRRTKLRPSSTRKERFTENCSVSTTTPKQPRPRKSKSRPSLWAPAMCPTSGT